MYITLEEIKGILGITDTSQDSTITALIPSAESVVLGIIGVSDLISHDVIGEKLEVVNPYKFFLREFPIDTSSIVLKDIDFVDVEVDVFYQQPNALREVYMKNADDTVKTIYCNHYNVSYTAGYADADSVPSDIKTATAFVLNGLLASNDSKNGAVESYKIDDVISVKFASSVECQQTKTLLMKYV